MRRKKSNKTVMRKLRKSWAELADMKVGRLILEGGDRTWTEILRRVDHLNKSLKEGTRK